MLCGRNILACNWYIAKRVGESAKFSFWVSYLVSAHSMWLSLSDAENAKWGQISLGYEWEPYRKHQGYRLHR